MARRNCNSRAFRDPRGGAWREKEKEETGNQERMEGHPQGDRGPLLPDVKWSCRDRDLLVREVGLGVFGSALMV